MSSLRILGAIGMGLLAWSPSAVKGQAPVEVGDISAPFHYESTMLVLVSEEGAAAVIFRGVGDGSVSYDYRFQSKDGTKTEKGTRALSERRDAKGNLAGELYIKAGPISIGWSYGGPDRGWIYYQPEKVKVHIAHAKYFADRVENTGNGEVRNVPKLDLNRFLK